MKMLTYNTFCSVCERNKVTLRVLFWQRKDIRNKESAAVCVRLERVLLFLPPPVQSQRGTAGRQQTGAARGKVWARSLSIH